MLRARFYLPRVEDYRPVTFPPPGPYWCTGYLLGSLDGSIPDTPVIVAYVETEEQITEFWPEASEIDIHERDVEPYFSDRFPRPEWWGARKQN